MSSLRDVLTVRFRHPKAADNASEFSERLACEPEAPNLVRLLEFSDLLPLVPGDLLIVDHEGIAIAVEEYNPGIVGEAYFHGYVDEATVAATAELWGRATQVQATAVTVMFVSQSATWISDVLRNNELVEHVDVRRRPGDEITLSLSGNR